MMLNVTRVFYLFASLATTSWGINKELKSLRFLQYVQEMMALNLLRIMVVCYTFSLEWKHTICRRIIKKTKQKT